MEEISQILFSSAFCQLPTALFLRRALIFTTH
jgi:hypothetical protein